MPGAVLNITLQEAGRLYESHSSHPHCHPTCPGPQRILLSKRQAVSPSHFWSKTAHGAKRITLRGAFSTSHFRVVNFKLAAGGEPSTWFPPGGLVETAGNAWLVQNHVFYKIVFFCGAKHSPLRFCLGGALGKSGTLTNLYFF